MGEPTCLLKAFAGQSARPVARVLYRPLTTIIYNSTEQPRFAVPVYVPISSPFYSRAPIIEAVIELRIVGNLAQRTVDKIAKRVKKRYAHQAPLQHFDFKLDMTGSGNAEVHQRATGFRLATDDQADIALVTQTNLTTARLSPYPGWDTFRAIAQSNWADWQAVAAAFPLARMGARYINRLDIPIGADNMIKLDQYVAVFPRTELLERPLSGFTVQASFETFLPHWSATITTAPMFPPPVPGHLSLLLDIDVARSTALPEKADDLWPMMDEARVIKNDLFERALTPTAKELFHT